MRRIALPLVFLLSSCSITLAQCINQANGGLNTNLFCMTPNLYGSSLNRFANPPEWQDGITLSSTVPQHFAHFTGSSIQSFTALDTAVSTQLSLLPLVTPAAGVAFVFSGGVVTQATSGFGPILGERGETVGRHHLHLALTYQHFAFDELDGVSLDHVPTVYHHFLIPGVNPDTSRWENDVIAADNRVDLKVNQWTATATFGLTNRIDVSAAIPILNVTMGVSSNALIVRAPGSIADCAANFPTIPGGQCHSFLGANPDQKTYFSSGSAHGIGDVVLRVKGNVLKREHAAVALGADLRLATGDETNLLGSGATGFRPFIAMSYRGRVTPHINLGYEWNGSSILAGQVQAGGQLTSSRLPDQLFYIAGADVGITRKLGGAVDLIGQRVIGASRIFPGTFTTTGGIDLANINEGRESYQMNNMSVGVKYAPRMRLILTANVMFRVDNAGLRAKAVPLVGASYTF